MFKFWTLNGIPQPWGPDIRLSRKGNLSDTVNPAPATAPPPKKPVKSLNLKPYDLSSFRAFTSAILALMAFRLFLCCHLAKLSLNASFFVKTSTSLDRCGHSFWTCLCWRLLLLICTLFTQMILSGHDMLRHNWRHWGYRGWSKWQSVYCRPLSSRTFSDDGAILYLCYQLSVNSQWAVSTGSNATVTGEFNFFF